MHEDMKRVLELHRHGGLGTRIRIRGRTLLSDMDLIERQVPRTGSIVDIGCGDGIFSNLMAIRSSERKVLGFDKDTGKIDHARATIGGRQNIDFTVGDAFHFPFPQCDGITIVDITYLISKEKQWDLLEICRRNLKPGGKLVWKTQETRPRWKYAFMYAQETAGSLAGITRSGQRNFFYLDRSEALKAMERAGFKAEVVEMPTRLPYSEVLYIGS